MLRYMCFDTQIWRGRLQTTPVETDPEQHQKGDHMSRLSESLNTNEPSQATHAVRNTHATMQPQKAKTHSTFNLLRHLGHVGHQKTMEKNELKCGICTSWLGVKMVKSSISLLISLS